MRSELVERSVSCKDLPSRSYCATRGEEHVVLLCAQRSHHSPAAGHHPASRFTADVTVFSPGHDHL